MFRSVWARIAALFAATAVVATPLALTQGSGKVDVFVGSTPTPVSTPAADTANLFIVSGGGACSRSATLITYASSSSPDARCGDFDTAYSAAAANDTINCQAGSYGAQDVFYRSGITGVTFDGNDQACVVAEMDNYANSVTYDGVDFDAAGAATVIAFENHGDETATPNGAGHHVTVQNSSIGDVRNVQGTLNSGDYLTFDNVLFHDAIAIPAPDIHMECAYMLQTSHLVVKNSTFRNCAIYALTFTWGDWWTPQPPAYNNVLIENNVFTCPRQENSTGYHVTGASLHIGANGPNGANQQLDNWDIRYNSFCNFGVEGTRTAINSAWKGNVGGLSCVSGVTYTYNVGDTCSGSNSVSVSPATYDGSAPEPTWFVSETGYDFHLTLGAAAIGAGDPADFPTLDRDGVTRGNPPDAGAYEYTG